MDRRQFLAATAAALATASCAGQNKVVTKATLAGLEVPEPTAAQRAKRRSAKESTVALVRCQSYEDDLLARMKKELANLNVPDFKGKKVVLKPNMVEFQPGHPITTDPAMLIAAVQLLDYLG